MSTEDKIVPVHYEPPATYDLDLEILAISALRQKANAHCKAHTLEHIEFYLLIYITEGQCVHMVDFESIDCARGSLICYKYPNQWGSEKNSRAILMVIIIFNTIRISLTACQAWGLPLGL